MTTKCSFFGKFTRKQRNVQPNTKLDNIKPKNDTSFLIKQVYKKTYTQTFKRQRGGTLNPGATTNIGACEAVCAYTPLSASLWQVNRQGPHPQPVDSFTFPPGETDALMDAGSCNLQSWAHLPGCKHQNKGHYCESDGGRTLGFTRATNSNLASIDASVDKPIPVSRLEETSVGVLRDFNWHVRS